MMLRMALVCGLALSACTQPQPLPPADPVAMRVPAQVPPRAPSRPNGDIARDFLELSFRMESGRILPALTRFEGPVLIAVTGPAPEIARRDLALLLARLRQEAEIDIAPTTDATRAQIVVEFLPLARMQAVVPHAACFVVPRVGSWPEFRRRKLGPDMDWGTLPRRERATVFIPFDTSPQEMRDCLHEEIAQALGPLNDLYRLPDSVFNDDNFHTLLTGFDMLILRATYAPELSSGMSREEVAARLPALLRRLNPGGERRAGPDPGPTPLDWVAAIETALTPGQPPQRRQQAAFYAVDVAQREDWQDARMAFTLFTLSRVAAPRDATLAVEALVEAARLYAALPQTGIHLAHIDIQMAAFALAAGQPDRTLLLVDRARPAMEEAGNAALLSASLMLRASALLRLGRDEEARAVRLDSLSWARYGFGDLEQVQARLSEIDNLGP